MMFVMSSKNVTSGQNLNLHKVKSNLNGFQSPKSVL